MAPTAVCTFFLQGRCRNGDSCTFLHQNAPPASKWKGKEKAKEHPVPATGSEARRPPPSASKKREVPVVAPVVMAVGRGRKGVSTGGEEDRAKKGALFVPCKFFQAGFCVKGEECTFQHVMPTVAVVVDTQSVTASQAKRDEGKVSAEPKERPPGAGKNSIDHSQTAIRVMGATLSVIYGSGLEIASIAPASATSILTIHHLPAEIEQQAIVGLLQPFDIEIDTDAIRLTALESSTYATVKLIDPAAVERAVASLDGLMYNGRGLLVKPYLPKGISHLSSPVTRVSCMWYPPSKTALLRPSLATKEELRKVRSQIKGRWVHGRKLDCILRDRILSVGNMAPGVTKSELKALLKGCKDCAIEMLEPNYTFSQDEVLAQVVSLLETNKGDIENCEILSPPEAAKTKAIIRFKSETAAVAAVRRYNDTKHSFLGQGPLFLQIVYTAMFKVPAEVHLAMAQELAAIGFENKEKIRLKTFGGQNTGGKRALVTVRLTGQKKEDVAKMKSLVGAILRGQLCIKEGGAGPLWDSFFQTATGLEVVNAIARETHTYIYCDKRKCQIFLFGSEDNRERASKLLHEALAATREVGFQVVSLDVAEWRLFIRDRLAGLRGRFGSEKLKINALKRTVEFKGAPADLAEFNGILQSGGVQAKGLDKLPSNLGECPVCFCTPDEPTQFSPDPCSHVYCKACLVDYVKSTLDTRKFPITCVAMNEAQDGVCGSGLCMPTASQTLPPHEFETILTTAFNDYIRQRPTEYMYCPTANCNTVYKATTDGKLLTCVDCLLEICTSCHVDAHDGQTCAQYQASHDPEAQEREFAEWKERNGVKACPRCKTDIQKASGCDHMTCASCKAHICWKCMQVFDASEPVYTHMNRVHGGIGIE